MDIKKALEVTPKEERVLQELASKVKPVTDEERQLLRRLFLDKLDAVGKTQTDWCREQEDLKPSNLSNALSGAIESRPVLSLVARYVIDDNWK